MQARSFPVCVDLVLNPAVTNMSECKKIGVTIPIYVKWVSAKKNGTKFKELV